MTVQNARVAGASPGPYVPPQPFTGPPSSDAIQSSTQPAYQWRFRTALTTNPGAAFVSRFTSETYNSVVETAWSFGYNADGALASHQQGYFKIHPDAGDTNSLEIQATFVTPDGGQCFPFQFNGKLDGTDTATMAFEMPTGGGSWAWLVQGEPTNRLYLSLALGANATTQLVLQTPTSTGPSQAILSFDIGGTETFRVFADGNNAFYVRDLIHGIYPVTFNADSHGNQWLAGSWCVNNAGAGLATNATDGFLYVPTCAGAPTGVPRAQAGSVPLAYDTTNDKLWIYRGGTWAGVAI